MRGKLAFAELHRAVLGARAEFRGPVAVGDVGVEARSTQGLCLGDHVARGHLPDVDEVVHELDEFGDELLRSEQIATNHVRIGLDGASMLALQRTGAVTKVRDPRVLVRLSIAPLAVGELSLGLPAVALAAGHGHRALRVLAGLHDPSHAAIRQLDRLGGASIFLFGLALFVFRLFLVFLLLGLAEHVHAPLERIDVRLHLVPLRLLFGAKGALRGLGGVDELAGVGDQLAALLVQLLDCLRDDCHIDDSRRISAERFHLYLAGSAETEPENFPGQQSPHAFSASHCRRITRSISTSGSLARATATAAERSSAVVLS